MSIDKDDTYQFILRYLKTPADFFQRFRSLLSELITIITKAKLGGVVEINIESLRHMVIDYYTDIIRLKDFQLIDFAKVHKIYSYGLFWFLRRHPLQILTQDDKLFDINERIAIALFLPKILKENKISYQKIIEDKKTRESLFDFINLLFYTFKYGIYTQQSLELMIEAFCTGIRCAAALGGPAKSVS
jgi:hypothetical protein